MSHPDFQQELKIIGVFMHASNLKRSQLGLCVALACLSTAISAQTPLASEKAIKTDKKPEAIDEIIVTANKRPDPIQKVPLAVSVVTEAQLEAAGVTGFADLVKLAPALTLTQGDQPGNSTIYLRGIGTTGISVGIASSVSVQIDDVPVGFRQRVFSDLLDVERIEVLRGPQSTLYGQSASAGLINIITKEPSDDFQSKISLSNTTDRRSKTGAMLSGPLSPTIGFRASAGLGEWGGSIKNNNTGNLLNGSREFNSRAKFVWTPNAELNAMLALSYSRQSNACCVSVLLTQPPTLAVGSIYNGVVVSPVPVLAGFPGKTLETILPGITPGEANRNVNIDAEPYQRGNDYGQAFKIKYNFSGYELAATLGNSRYYLDDGVDSDFSTDPSIEVVQYGYAKAASRNAELKLTSPGNRQFRFVAGLFADKIEAERYLYRIGKLLRVGTTTTTRALATASDYLAKHNTGSVAAYTQADWEITKGTTLTGGLRAQESKIDYTFSNNLTTPPTLYPNDPARNFTAPSEKIDRPITGRLSLQHQINNAFMIYTSYATGYKNGAFDLSSAFSDAGAKFGAVRPEKSKSYEIGTKSQWFERRLTLNATAFFATYNDYQARKLDTELNTVVFSNIPRVRTKGFEIDTSVRLTTALKLNTFAAFTRATSLEFPAGDCYSLQTVDEGCIVLNGRSVQSLSGKALPNAPKWKFSNTLSYDRPLPDSKLSANFTATHTWQSAVNFTLSGDPIAVQSAYGLLNLGLNIRDNSSESFSYSYGIFVNNVLNKDYSTNRIRSPWFYTAAANAATRIQGPGIARTLGRDADRYVGIRFSANY
jgi:iron complex outermembrane recepter protein